MKSKTALLIFLFLGNSSWLSAYDLDTHSQIAIRSARPEVSSLDQLLKTDAGLAKGINQKFFEGTNRERTVEELIGDGARFEDEPSIRVRNHFHNPLYQADGSGRGSWFQAGLFGTFQSSIHWGQNPNQASTVFGGSWSWQNARQRYLEALSGTTAQGVPLSKDRRDESFADTFRALGHLTHLVQDLSVPAHVRNDSHLVFVDDDGYEDWVSRNRPRVQSLIAAEPTKPDLSIFSLGVPITDLIAKVPVARLWDSDQYSDNNPDITLSPTIGLAEYTNANFFSDDTVLKSFPFPAQTSLELHPEVDIDPTTGEERRYFAKVRDGDPVDYIAVPSQLHKFLPDAFKDRKIGLDDKVLEDYASKLLPRAVGYSAGLLDYFFRGKLDVDLIPDPDSTDPTVVKLSGTYETTNDSTDRLVDGTLALYADNPNDGTRSAVPSLEPLNISDVAPGQEISRRFQVNQEAERFVAVYQGTLGNEVKNPTNNFPGGVIGKVLGGVRVEQLFKDSVRWYLRTPKDIFPLPILVQDVEDLRWGDKDNTLVGRSRLGPDEPNLFYSFEIKRQEGSLEPRLVPDQETEVVDLTRSDLISFPFGISAGTVHLSHTIEYKQRLVTAFRIKTATWNGFNYQLTNVQYTDPQIRQLVDETQTLNRSFPVTLGLDSYGGRFGPLYAWSVQDIALNSQGKILALISVRPNLILEGAEFPFYELTAPIGGNGNDDLRTVVSPSGPAFYYLTYPFNMGPILRALVNVGSGEIVASTAPLDQDITISHRTAASEFDNFSPSKVFTKTIYVGGFKDGVFSYGDQDVIGNFPDNCAQPPILPFNEPFIKEIGYLQATIDQYRPEIAQYQSAATPSQTERTTRYFITCGMAFDILERSNRYNTTRIGSVSRIRSESGPDSWVLIMDLYDATTRRNRSKLLHWTPDENKAPLRQEFFEPAGLIGKHSIRSASRGAALISSTFTPPIFTGPCGSSCFSTSTLVPLEEGPSSIVLQDINPTDFVMLEPEFLYSVRDLKFYTKQASPQRTALPLTLAPGGTVPSNGFQYHALKVP